MGSICFCINESSGQSVCSARWGFSAVAKLWILDVMHLIRYFSYVFWKCHKCFLEMRCTCTKSCFLLILHISACDLSYCIFSSRSRWGCQITDNGLYRMSFAKCISNLTSISLWGLTGITDKGVVQLVCDLYLSENKSCQKDWFCWLSKFCPEVICSDA